MQIQIKVTPRNGEPYFYNFGEETAALAYAADLNFNDDMRDRKEISKIELVVGDKIIKRI